MTYWDIELPRILSSNITAELRPELKPELKPGKKTQLKPELSGLTRVGVMLSGEGYSK
jgi:hypothetical protein